MVKRKFKGQLEVIKTLAEHKRKHGLSIKDICQETGCFPSDAEQTIRDLQESGSVKCYIYKGDLYAIFQDRSSKMALKKLKTTEAGKKTEIGMHG